MPPRPSSAPLIVLVAVLLFIGAFVNITISVMRALPGDVEVRHAGKLAAPAPRAWPRRMPADWPAAPRWSNVNPVQWGYQQVTVSGSVPVSEGFRLFELVQMQSGWPLFSLERELRAETLNLTTNWPAVRYEVPESIWRGGITIGGQRYPIRPIWSGFVFNTLLYAAVGAGIWAGLCGSARMILRRRRKRRDRCHWCGYSRSGLAEDARCPECGRDP